MATPSFTHLDAQGHARMVDIGHKPATSRCAIAQGKVRISAELAQAIASHTVAKGSVLDVARLAGIMAAKRTDEIIPLCHSLPLDAIHVDLALENQVILIRAEARTTWKTGVEMEALTAVTVAALTVVDMGKAIDKHMVIEDVRLLKKTGGRSDTHAHPAGDHTS